MTFDSSKNLAGIGSILLFIGLIPPVGGYTFGVLPVVGVILLLIGMKGLADYYREAGIFNYALYGTIVAIVGIIIVAAITFLTLVNFLHVIVPGWNGDWTNLATQINQGNVSSNITPNDVIPYAGMFLVDWIVVFAFTLAFTILYRRSLSQLAGRTGIGLFGATGTVLLVGGALSIIFIGFILIWVAMLLLAIAFFQAKEPIAQPTPPPQYPPQYPPQVPPTQV